MFTYFLQISLEVPFKYKKETGRSVSFLYHYKADNSDSCGNKCCKTAQNTQHSAFFRLSVKGVVVFYACGIRFIAVIDLNTVALAVFSCAARVAMYNRALQLRISEADDHSLYGVPLPVRRYISAGGHNAVIAPAFVNKPVHSVQILFPAAHTRPAEENQRSGKSCKNGKKYKT